MNVMAWPDWLPGPSFAIRIPFNDSMRLFGKGRTAMNWSKVRKAS